MLSLYKLLVGRKIEIWDIGYGLTHFLMVFRDGERIKVHILISYVELKEPISVQRDYSNI